MSDSTIRQLRPALGGCPICGSQPRRSTSRGQAVVVCYAGSHRLQSLADTQTEADANWNSMAADWATRNSRGSQVNQSIRVIEAIADVEHVATAIDRNGLNSRSAQLRNAARILSAAIATPPTTDASERMREALGPFAKLGGPINGEAGRPTYVEAIGGNDCGEELQLSTYVGNGTRIEVMHASDFHRAFAALTTNNEVSDEG